MIIYVYVGSMGIIPDDIYIYIYTYIYIYAYVCIYIYIHTHVHTYIYIHIKTKIMLSSASAHGPKTVLEIFSQAFVVQMPVVPKLGAADPVVGIPVPAAFFGWG